MRYKNAKEVLPQELIDEINRYASGMLLYIPKIGERTPWGVRTGIRDQNLSRNHVITQLYLSGVKFDELSEIYHLTPETIRNIVYSGKDDNGKSIDENSNVSESAREFIYRNLEVIMDKKGLETISEYIRFVYDIEGAFPDKKDTQEWKEAKEKLFEDIVKIIKDEKDSK